MSVYAPNSHQIRFLGRLFNRVRSKQYGSFIGGDFILIVDPKMDTSVHKNNNNTYLNKVLHNAELFDAWRCLHANERDYTFFLHRQLVTLE